MNFTPDSDGDAERESGAPRVDAPPSLRVPRGNLVRSRVVEDPATTLRAVLDEELTGYVVVEPQDALLLGAETRAVVTFEDGVPLLAYEVDADTGGPDALADLAVPGPYRVELYELPRDALAEAHRSEAFRVPPDMPAERLAGDPELAERTRAAAPDERLERVAGADPVEAFLADAEKIEAIREQAREEARARAEEWGLSAQLADDAADH